MKQTTHQTRVARALVAIGVVGLAAAIAAQGTAKVPGNIWPPAKKQMEKSIALTPEEEMKTFSMPPGYHVELVAVGAARRIADPDRLRRRRPVVGARDADLPARHVGARLDRSRSIASSCSRTPTATARWTSGRCSPTSWSMPRALKVLDHGVLVGEPPNLWLMKDTDGDLKADTKELVTNTYGNPNGGIEHNANSVFWAMDNVMYSSEHVWNLRWKNGKFETAADAQPRPVAGLAGRRRTDLSQRQRFAAVRRLHAVALLPPQSERACRTRGLYELLIEQVDATVYPVRSNRGVNRGYRDPFFRADDTSIVIQGAGTPTIYRGDSLSQGPAQGNAFITDSPTNLVHQFVLTDDGTGRLKAKNGYPRGEFLASSDERFRPVSLFDGPTATCTSWTCIAASCRPAASGAST